MKSQQVNKWVVDNSYILMILSVALVLRTWGADFGLPDFVFHTDENYALAKSMNLFNPEGRPEIFITIFHIWGWLLYKFLSIFKVIITLSGNNELTTADFLIVTRLIQGLLSTGSVCLVYLIGKKMFNERFGLIASLFLTFTFVDVQTAHYFRQDTYLQFFGLLMIYFYLRQRKNIWIWMFIIGIIGAMRITAWVYAIPIFIDYWFRLKRNIFNRLIVLLGLGFVLILGLLFGHIEAILSGRFIDYLNVYFKFYTKDSFNWVGGDSSNGVPSWKWWIFYLNTTGFFYSIIFTLILGIIWSIKDLKKLVVKKQYIYLGFMIALVFYYIALSVRSVSFDRHFVPVSPFVALISTYSLMQIWKLLDSKLKNSANLLISIILVLLLIFPAIRSTIFVYQIGLKDTREMALEWLLENYDRKQIIVTTGSINVIGQNLQKRGYVRVKNFFDVNNYEQLQQFPEALYMISSRTFRVWENYQNVDSVKDNWNSYKEIKSQYRLVKKFEPSVVSGSFFSPYNLEHSSTVNAYHNPVVEIYEIIN